MGSSADVWQRLGINARSSEEPQHQVTLTHSFLMQETMVTKSEFLEVYGDDGRQLLPRPECMECPVYVSWFDAVRYANRLSQAEGLEPCYDSQGVVLNQPGGKPYSCEGYRLPTEAEWEYAYRAGTTTDLYSGDLEASPTCDSELLALDEIAWYCGNSSEVQPVGQKAPNAWGLYDMAGNGGEWVGDTQRSYEGSAEIDPWTAGMGVNDVTVPYAAHFNRMVRGGGFVVSDLGEQSPPRLRGAFRQHRRPRAYYIGFRVVRARPRNLDACGNGTLDEGEECDDGNLNSDIEPDGCRTRCIVSFCGDGVQDAREQCDDGNGDDLDGCSSECAPEPYPVDCTEIYRLNPDTRSGFQVIDPDGPGGHPAFRAYCYMDLGGGWTEVHLALSEEEGEPPVAPRGQDSVDFLSRDSAHDYDRWPHALNNPARHLVALNEVRFQSPARNQWTHVYTGPPTTSLLDIPEGSFWDYEPEISNAPIPMGICDAMGSYRPDGLFIGKQGSRDRDYYFSPHDTDSSNQAGYFCWNGEQCDGSLFGDCSGESGVRIMVRRTF
jgi:cysteine-rich repeat protein